MIFIINHEWTWSGQAATKSLLWNHEFTRMNTNLGQSTEYTEETECLADVGHRSEEFVGNMLF